MKLIIFTTIIFIFMVTTCCAQFQPATINAFSNNTPMANLSNITNATLVHNTATNTTFLLLPANGANFTALQQQFGNNTPQFIQNNTVILIPFNATQHPNISEQFPSVVNRTYTVNMTSYDQRPNQSTIPGNTNNPGTVPSAPSSMYPPRGDTGNTQGNYGFVIPTVPVNNPTSNINYPNNPSTSNNIPTSNMAPKNTPNSNVQHINNPGQQPNHPNSNSGHQPNTTNQNKNSGTTLKSSLIYIVILEVFVGYLLF